MRSALFFDSRGRSPSRTSAWMLLLVVATLSSVGCGHLGVKPHQRELLADRIMKLDGDAQEKAADEHVLSNREGAIGGTGTSGGGCGCN